MSQTSTLGRIVLFRLSEADVLAIQAARGSWPQTDVSRQRRPLANAVRAGEVYPAVVVRAYPTGTTHKDLVNLRVLLDGDDTYWVTSRKQGDDNGQWQWPHRVEGSGR